MGKIKGTIVIITSLAAVAAVTVTFQQYSRYSDYLNILLQSDSKNRALRQQLEEVLPQQDAFMKQLAAAQERYQDLRRQLPSELMLDKFKASFEGILAQRKLKVLAQREARYNRPLYQEVRLSYSIKGSESAVQRALTQLRKQERLIVSDGAKKESDENSGLVLSIFSVPAEQVTLLSMPNCLEPPRDIWFPLLQQELMPLYQDYLRDCEALQQDSGLYQDMQRYRQLSEQLLFLENVRKRLTEK
jgi:hypothetical protein